MAKEKKQVNPKDKNVEERALTLADTACTTVVIDQPTLDKASVLLGQVKALRTEVAGIFDPIIAKAHATHKEALSQKKKVDTPLATAERIIKTAMVDYVDSLIVKRSEEELLSEEMAKAGLGDLAFKEHVPAPDMGGAYTITTWHAEVTSMHDLTTAVASGQVTKEMEKAGLSGLLATDLLLANMTVLNKMASALKADMAVPGVKAVSSTSIGRRS